MTTVKLPKLDFRADIKENSYDETNNTIEVVASVGSRVRRDPWFSESFVEELEISSEAIRLERFNSGAPLLMDHNLYSVRGQIGVIQRAWIENGELRAVVKFSSREEFQGIITDIKDGIIRNVSVGYKTHTREELEERDPNGLRIYRSTDWEPMELSFVTIGADPKAGTRSDDEQTTYDCETIERTNTMANEAAENKGVENRSEVGSEAQKPAQASKPEPKVDLDEVRSKAVEAERSRVADIRKACEQAKLDSKIDEFIRNGTSVDEVRKILLEDLATKDQSSHTSSVQVGENLTGVGMKRGMENAILHRIDAKKYELDKQGNNFRNMKLMDLVRDCLAAKGISHRNMTPMELAQRGLHSTSDFPEVLANVVNKTLRSAYNEAPQTFQPFTRMTTVSDFKEISRTQLGDAPKLLKKLENGEYQAGTVSEAAEKYSVEEYGRIVAIGRRVIVNDDLSAFTRLPGMMGRQARNLESDLIITELTSNPTMADGNALFSAAHGNLITGPGTAISITSLGVARALMRSQTSLDGSKLNLAPELLYVPVALETVADQFTSQIVPNTAGDVNPYGQNGRTPLRVGTESRLDDVSPIAWYMFANLGDIDMFEMAMLEGETGPMVDQMEDFYTDGIKFKIRHTIGVKAIDWRGMLKNDGA